MRLRLGAFVSLLCIFAAALSGPGLSDPAHASSPRLLTEEHDDDGNGKGEPGDPTPADALSSIPCTNGFADVYPCQGVDLLSFVPLADLGDIQTAGIWGWTDPVTRREYALIALASRASFVDITGRPRVVGYLPAHTDLVTSNREINVYRDHAFVVADGAGAHGIQIFDLTRLRSARPTRTSRAATSRSAAWTAGCSSSGVWASRASRARCPRSAGRAPTASASWATAMRST